MGKYLVTMGDFLKNAGIVGLNYMLDMSDAESGKDYGIKMQNRPVDGLELYEQGLWLDEDFVQQCDWTGMYFDACVNYYGDFTVLTRLYAKLIMTNGSRTSWLKKIRKISSL